MHLSLRNIQKHYAGAAALNGVDLDIVSGELIALLGPSGSGKTTLLRIIAGLTEATSGDVVRSMFEAMGEELLRSAR